MCVFVITNLDRASTQYTTHVSELFEAKYVSPQTADALDTHVI